MTKYFRQEDCIMCEKTCNRMVISEHISLLISHYMTGTCSDQELSELYAWLDASDENKSAFLELMTVHSAGKVLEDSMFEAKKQRMLLRLNNRIDAQELVEKRRTRAGMLWIFAAASILVVAGFLFLYRGMSGPVGQAHDMFAYVNPTSEISVVTLEDGTKVSLGPESRIDYYLSSSSEGTERIAELKGKAFFEVCKDSTCPFIVNAGELLVKVLGTKFVVQAHPDSSDIQVMLQEGSVRLQTPDRVNLVRLVPDQKAVYRKASSDLDVENMAVASFVLNNFEKISFERVRISELIAELEAIFDVILRHDGDIDEETTYEINFNRSNTLPEVLAIVEALTGERLRVVP